MQFAITARTACGTASGRHAVNQPGRSKLTPARTTLHGPIVGWPVRENARL